MPDNATNAATNAMTAAASAGKTVVEVLYPEYANQAGDNGNAMYLRACLPDATFVETSHDDVPYFVDYEPSLVLLCGMSEAQQEKTIELLMPYRDRLNELVDAGVPMLFTGSAPEVLGSKIVNPDGSEVAGLGILDFVTHRNMPERYHDVVIGDFVPQPGEKPIKVVGFKIQFTQVEGPAGVAGDARYTTIEPSVQVGQNLAGGGCSQTRFCHNEVGFGLNKQSKDEGFRKNNLMATWLIGPLLPLNPDFTRYLLDLMGRKDVPLAFETEARAAYDERLKTFHLPGMGLAY